MAVKPWMEFPHRISLLKRGLQDLEAWIRFTITGLGFRGVITD